MDPRQDLGNTKKDQLMLSINGLSSVNFGSKNVDECLEKLVIGNVPGLNKGSDKRPMLDVYIKLK